VAWAVITTRLSEYDPQTLRQIGNRWGLSHERIRQIERVTRARLAAHLAPLDEAA
jgi:DNA-directed RNA polymerase sigma subunit (sigma70/sigma32)